MSGHVATGEVIDLDNVPEYFSYTNFGRTASAKSLTASATEMTIDTVDFERSRRSSGARTSRPIVTGTVNSGGITATSTNFRRLDEGRMLVMNPSAVLDVDEAIIAVDLLQLQDGTELRIANNVKYLTILARSHHDRRQHVDHVGIHGAGVSRPARAARGRYRDEPQPYPGLRPLVLLRSRRRRRRRLPNRF